MMARVTPSIGMRLAHSCRCWKTEVSRCLAITMLPCSSLGIRMFSGRKHDRHLTAGRDLAGTSAPDAPLAWGERAGGPRRSDERQ
jgi:hypothetical protein